MTVLLSHRLDTSQPNWPDSPGLDIVPHNRIGYGADSNTHVLRMYNHYGTHVDAPYHFLPDGRRIGDLSVSDFVFTAPVLVDIPLSDEQAISPEHVDQIAELAPAADLLLLRSGFEAHRGERERYERHSPGFSPEGALALRRTCPRLRGVGMDWLSACPYSARPTATAVHRALLEDNDAGGFVLIFEDMSLAPLGDQQPRVVYALPLFIDALDGAPCTIAAEV